MLGCCTRFENGTGFKTGEGSIPSASARQDGAVEGYFA